MVLAFLISRRLDKEIIEKYVSISPSTCFKEIHIYMLKDLLVNKS